VDSGEAGAAAASPWQALVEEMAGELRPELLLFLRRVGGAAAAAGASRLQSGACDALAPSPAAAGHTSLLLLRP
jgi:hypothetical protein